MALQAVEMTKAGHDVHVVSLSEPIEGPVFDQLDRAGVPISHVPSRRSQTLLDRARLRQLTDTVAELDPDLLHLHLDASILLGAAVARRLALPAAATLHGSAPDFARLAAVKRPVLHRALARLDRVIAVGPNVADTWQSQAGEVEPTVVVSPVTDLGAVVDRSDRGRGHRPVNLIAVGRLVHQKAYEVLVEAMRMVVMNEPTVRCRIAGEGPMRASIEAAIAAHGLGHHIELLGNRTDVDKLLADADVFVSSSISEGLPVSVLEAMASGLPVVATDVGDVRAALPPTAGTIVPSASPIELSDALLAMIEDPDRRLRCGLAGRKHVEAHHAPARWAHQLSGVYAEMLDTSTS